MWQKWCWVFLAMTTVFGTGLADANQKTSSSVSSMNIAEAHNILRRVLPHVWWFTFNGKGDDLARGDVSISEFTLVTKKTGQAHQCLLKDLGEVRTNRSWGSPTVDFTCGEGVQWRLCLRGFDAGTIEQVVGALSVLKAASSILPPDHDPIFQETVRNYRSSPAKPTLSEDARRFKVEAEAAVNDKRFEETVDFYGRALELPPWWPEGHFNRAMLRGEVDAFELAVIEMQRYLALVPDAPDARAAQDKIYVWQSRAAASPEAVQINTKKAAR